MDTIQQSILQSIQDGRYFEDAKEWYIYRAIAPYTERVYVTVFFVLVVASMLLIITNINRLFPAETDVQVVVTTPDIMTYYSSIHRLADDSVAVQHSVATYLLKRYVMFRETYRYDALPVQLQRMKHMSSKQEMKRFYDGLLLQNPSSPLFLMQKHAIRTIDDVVVRLEGNPTIPNEATITYRATIQNLRTGQQTISTESVHLVFLMDDIASLPEDAKTLLFSVVEYHPVASKGGGLAGVSLANG